MNSIAVVLCLAIAAAGEIEDSAAAPVLSGNAFAEALEQPFAATWEHVDLRRIARRIAAARGTTVLLDRRLDPSREQSLTADGEPLGTFLESLADKAGGSLSVTASVAYLGPLEAALKLRTLVFLRQNELVIDENGIPRTRRAELSKPVTFQWNDVSQPAEIVRQLAEQRRLEIDGLEQVPYDLWAGGTAPRVSLAEALTLVLIQFDRTFEWIDHGARIRIVPIPERVDFEREHLPRKGQSASAALAQWREADSQLDARISGGKIVVRGTLEQHEALERLRKPGSIRRTPGSLRLKPLQQERFTLRIRNSPVRALLNKLAEPAYGQLTFEFDADALRQAGIDLDQRVSFEVKGATIEELLKAALDPLDTAFELDGRTVRLKPRE